MNKPVRQSDAASGTAKSVCVADYILQIDLRQKGSNTALASPATMFPDVRCG